MTRFAGAPEQRAESRHCRACARTLSGRGLHLGDLPPCNRFLSTPGEIERHPLTMLACDHCGLVQLDEPMPVEALTPRIGWIRYNEPERHLDDLVERLPALLGRPVRSAIGVSPFEGPLHARMTARGVAATALALPTGDAPGRFPYLETWQRALETGRFLAWPSEVADIVSCRYILEHCHDPVVALKQLGRLAADDGLVLVEVPDSGKFLAAGDYCFPWEEHVSYFVEETLTGMCRHAGFEVVTVLRYPGALEDALVAVLRKGGSGQAVPAGPGAFPAYRDGFEEARARLHSVVSARAGANRDRVALFGIGHQAIMFVNAFGLGEFIAAAVDDDANKRGHFPPGFRVPVTSSAELLENHAIGTCLLAVSPAAEDKIRGLLAPLAGRGVAFHSIFAGVDGSILLERS